MADIGAYGVGVQLYFNFICALSFVFMIMGFFVCPALDANGRLRGKRFELISLSL
jgi:hypothetical protein